MSNRGKLLAGVSVGALVAAPEAAMAMGGPKWGAHVELGGKFSDDRQIGSADFFMPLWQDQFSLLFADVRGRFDNKDSLEGNFGLGYRKQVNKDWIVGGYAFYDVKESEFDNKFSQLMAGFEAMSEDWEVRVNGYLPEDDVKPVSGSGGGGGTSSVRITGTTIQLVTPGNGAAEQAFYGADAEVGFKVPLFDANDDGKELRVFAGGFHFDSDMAAQQIAGPRGRAELRMFDVLGTGSRFVLGGEVQRDDVRGTEAYGTVQIRVPLQSTKSKRLAGLDRRMLNTVQRDVDIVSNLIPGVNEIVEDVIIDFQGVGTETIVFADKYGDPSGAGTVDDPTTLEQAQYALGKDADNNQIVPGIIVINDDDDGDLSGIYGIQLRPNQALIGGGLPVVLTGAETGRQVAHAFDGDTNEDGTLLLAANDGKFIRLANNNEVGGFSIYGDGYNGKDASDIGIYGGEGVNQAFIRDLNIYNMSKAGVSIENFNNEDRNIRIDNLLVDVGKYNNVDNRANLGRGVNLGLYGGSDVLAADDGILDIDISITNSTIVSGGNHDGIRIEAGANEGSVTTNIAVTDNNVTNVLAVDYGKHSVYILRDDAIRIDQFIGGGDGVGRFNTLVADNAVGGGRTGIRLQAESAGGSQLVHNARVEGNALYGVKGGISVKTGTGRKRNFSGDQIFGNEYATFKGSQQTDVSGTINITENVMARPNYEEGARDVYGLGIGVYNGFFGATVSGTEQAAGQIINVSNNNLSGVRGGLIRVDTRVGVSDLQAVDHGDNQQYQTARLNDDALSFVNQQITVSGNSNTYVPDQHGAPEGDVVLGGIQITTNVYGGTNRDANAGLGNRLELVDVRQDINVTDNDVENVFAPPQYDGSGYYYYSVTNAGYQPTVQLNNINFVNIGRYSGEKSVGIQVVGYVVESQPRGGTPQQVSLAQSLNVSGNTVSDLRNFPGIYGYGYQQENAYSTSPIGSGRGIEVVVEGSGGADVYQAGEVSGNTVNNVFGRGISVGAYADEFKANDNRPSYVRQNLNMDDNQIDNVFGESYFGDSESGGSLADSELSGGIIINSWAGNGEGEGVGEAALAVYQSVNIGGETGTVIEGASSLGIGSLSAVEAPGLAIKRQLTIDNTTIDGTLGGGSSYCPDYGCTETGIGIIDLVETEAANAYLIGETVITNTGVYNVRDHGIYNRGEFRGGTGNSQSLSVTGSTIEGGVDEGPQPANVDNGKYGAGIGIGISTLVTGELTTLAHQTLNVQSSQVSSFEDAGISADLYSYKAGGVTAQNVTVTNNNAGGQGFGVSMISGIGIAATSFAYGNGPATRTINISGNNIGYIGFMGVFDSTVAAYGNLGTSTATIENNDISYSRGFGIVTHGVLVGDENVTGTQTANVNNNDIYALYKLPTDGPDISFEIRPNVALFAYGYQGVKDPFIANGIVAAQAFYGENKNGGVSFHQNLNAVGNTFQYVDNAGIVLRQSVADDVRFDNSAVGVPMNPNVTQTFTTNGTNMHDGYSDLDLLAIQYGNGKQTGVGVPVTYEPSGGYACYQYKDGAPGAQQNVCNYQVNE